MFGLTRWSPFDDIFTFQREADRLFDQFWRDLPTRTGAGWSPGAFQVHTSDEGWRVDVPMPGIDPQYVNLEVTGSTLHIRAEVPGERNATTRYERSLSVPQFLDVERIGAAYRHGMLQLTLPLKESVRPRRIQIDTTGEENKQLTAAA